ncbi:MAG: hypothetical protein DI586_04295 [Micavibrio aeruginosavorus]|uniref:DUF5681 domain-containing protein n=1 Tax=Micavibrio aeruginosavorus TaxID=349221 RepID=A0A2W5FMR2_9BACT|nr:MAG: hypothetical protein DI586_04295 [Micavibrio aeruginosavorus]
MQRGRPFKKGQSGNPNGKPKGTQHHATRAVLQLLDGEADTLTRKAIELALKGDTTALRLCLERLAAPAKDKPIYITLPKLRGAEHAAEALASVIAEMSSGSITPSEAAAVAGLLETYRRTLETVDIEQRLAALENKGKN